MADTGNFFGPKPQDTGLLFFGPAETTRPITDNSMEELSNTYSQALSRPSEEVSADIQGGMLPTLKTDAGILVDSTRVGQTTGLIQETITSQPEDITGAVNLIREQSILGTNIAPDVAAVLEANPNSMLARSSKRAIERTVAFQRVAESRMEDKEDSMTATVGYFFDAAISEGIQNVLGVTLGLVTDGVTEGSADLRDLALELGDLLYTDVSEEEFLRRSEVILDRVQDSGLFTQDNPFLLNQFIALASEGAVGAEAEVQAIFALTDIATSATLNLAAGKLSRGLRSLPAMQAKIGTLDNAVETIVRASDQGKDLPINDLPRSTSPAMSTPLNDLNPASTPAVDFKQFLKQDTSVGSKIKVFDTKGGVVEVEVVAKSESSGNLVVRTSKGDEVILGEELSLGRSPNDPNFKLESLEGNPSVKELDVPTLEKTRERLRVKAELRLEAGHGGGELIRELNAITIELSRRSSSVSGKPDEVFMSSPDLRAMRQIEAENSALDIIRQGYAGSIIDDDVFDAVKADLVKGLREDIDSTYVNHAVNFNVVQDDFSNMIGQIYLGTNKGKPYLTLRNATIMAERVNGEVVEQLVEGQVQYLVKQETNIPFRELIDPTDPNELASSWFSRLGSTTYRTTEELDSRLVTAEAGLGAILSRASKAYTDIKRVTSSADIGKTNIILDELVNDPLYNWNTGGYSKSQFIERWGAKNNGEVPSDNAVAFYLKALEISDADFFVTADPILKNAVENGETMLKLDGTYHRAKPVSVPDGTNVFDVKSGQFIDSSTVPDGGVYTVHNSTYNTADGLPVQYVYSASPTTRRLYHTDVLGYRAGGRRVYTEANIYIKQDASTVMADGATVTGKPRTFLAVRTEAEAVKATNQFNNVVDALKSVAGNTLTGVDFRNAVKNALSGNKSARARLNAVLGDNSEWNINLSSIDDFIKFADEWRLDLSKHVDFAGDGKQLPVSANTFAGEETVGRVFETFNNPVGKRGVKPLKGYGGIELDRLDPTKAMENSFAKSVSRYGYSKYHENAVTGWLKGASGGVDGRNIISNWNDVKNLSPIQAMRKAVVDETTKAGRAFENERRTINFSLNSKTKDILAWESMVNVLADSIYDKGYTKAARQIDKMSGDPLKYLRSMAFNLKLGLFAFDQVWLQGSQIINVVSLSPKAGMRGSLAYLPIRLALDTSEDSVRRGIATRIAKQLGISEDDFVEMVTWIERSGRHIVDVNISELQGTSTLYKSGMSRLLSKGNVPFNEGELIARITSLATSIIEHKGNFPLDDIFSDKATRSIMRRQDILTASMSAASAAPWKKSMLSIPTQFLTYQQHMMEQIFVSGILTPKEKVRLLSSQAVILGSSGGAGLFGIGLVLDKLYYETGVQVNPEAYSLMRYGTLDYVLSALSGSKTAVAARIGVGDGMYDLIKNVGEVSFFEVAGGPSGGIAVDALDSLSQLIGHVFGGQFEYASYDWQSLGRNVTSVNRVYNGWVAARTGAYLSNKTGDPLMEDLSQVDAFMIGLGIPLQKNELIWSLYAFQKADTKVLQEHIRNAQRSENIARDYINKGDFTSAKAIWDDISAMRAILTPYELEQFDRAMAKTSTITSTLLDRAWDRRDWGDQSISGLAQALEATTAETE